MENNSLLTIAKKHLNMLRKINRAIQIKEWWLKKIKLLKTPYCWTIVVPVTILFYCLCYTDLNLPITFLFNDGEIFSYIEKLLNFLIPLFSIIVVAAIFIIQAIQAKNPDEELFSIVFNESLFYPILYFSLTIIGVMSFLYFKPVFISQIIVIRITVLSLYLFLFDLVMIGHLFIKAFKFLNTDYLGVKYLQDIYLHMENDIKQEAISRLSFEAFVNKMNNANYHENVLGQDYPNHFEVIIKSTTRHIIKDIKIHSLIKILSHHGNVYYKPLYINQQLPYQSKYLWIQNRDGLNLDLNKILKYSNSRNRTSELTKTKEKFKSRLDKYIQEQNIYSLNQILNYYRSIYEHFVWLSEKYSLDKIKPIQSFSYLNRNWSAIDGIEKHIISAFEKAVRALVIEGTQKIISFVDSLFILCIRSRNLEIFIQYRNIISFFYDIMLYSEEIKNLNMGRIGLRLKELAWIYIRYELENEQDRDKIIIIKKIRNELFKIFNDLLKKAMERNDFITYSKIIHELDQLRIRI